MRDFNGADQEGVGLLQVTQKNGKRFSAARAFLDPVRGGPCDALDRRTGLASAVQGHQLALRIAILLNPGGGWP
nr:GMC family oxidoreductase N-terminal domain-containing protein [Celeribacter baekdonensis]